MRKLRCKFALGDDLTVGKIYHINKEFSVNGIKMVEIIGDRENSCYHFTKYPSKYAGVQLTDIMEIIE